MRHHKERNHKSYFQHLQSKLQTRQIKKYYNSKRENRVSETLF
jgi:hypothetical protein